MSPLVTQGLVMGILGPSQPYLAHMVGVGSKEINFIWTVLAGGSCLSTLGVGAVFKVRMIWVIMMICVMSLVQSRITQQWQKLVFLSALVGICGLFVNLVPHMNNFYILLLSKLM